MNINDYNNVAQRIEADPNLKEKIMKKCKKQDKRHVSKRKFIPVMAAAAIGFASITIVSANEFMGIFNKHHNFEMAITEINSSQPNSESSAADTVPVLNATLKKWDENVINRIFAEGKNVVDGDEYQSDIDPNTTRKWFSYDDDSTVCYENGDISYWHKSDYNYEHIASILENANNYENSFFPEKNLKNLDKDSVVKQADDIMNDLGIPINSREVIALDKEHLIENDTCRNENGERVDQHDNILPEWTEEQEAYFIKYIADINGIPASSQLMDSGNCQYADYWYTNGSSIYVIINKNGIESFSAQMIYETSETGNTVSICSVEEAAAVINEKYEKHTAFDPIEINHCSLVYHAVPTNEKGTYEMHPYWEFNSKEEISWYTSYPEKDGFDMFNAIFVDAQTLEIVFDGNGPT